MNWVLSRQSPALYLPSFLPPALDFFFFASLLLDFVFFDSNHYNEYHKLRFTLLVAAKRDGMKFLSRFPSSSCKITLASSSIMRDWIPSSSANTKPSLWPQNSAVTLEVDRRFQLNPRIQLLSSPRMTPPAPAFFQLMQMDPSLFNFIHPPMGVGVQWTSTGVELLVSSCSQGQLNLSCFAYALKMVGFTWFFISKQFVVPLLPQHPYGQREQDSLVDATWMLLICLTIDLQPFFNWQRNRSSLGARSFKFVPHGHSLWALPRCMVDIPLQ